MTTSRTRTLTAALSAGVIAAAVLAIDTTPAAATAPACGNSALSVSHTATDSGAGHSDMVLLYKNVSHATCSLYGYPGLDALDSSGHVLAHAQRTMSGYAGGAHVKATVSIAPGQYASATTEWLNFNPVGGGTCTFSASIATTPANTTKTVHFPVSVSVCQLQVHPTVSGTSGRN
jgi:hypothetical protein